jgi:hypothetical protein
LRRRILKIENDKMRPMKKEKTRFNTPSPLGATSPHTHGG